LAYDSDFLPSLYLQHPASQFADLGGGKEKASNIRFPEFEIPLLSMPLHGYSLTLLGGAYPTLSGIVWESQTQVVNSDSVRSSKLFT